MALYARRARGPRVPRRVGGSGAERARACCTTRASADRVALGLAVRLPSPLPRRAWLAHTHLHRAVGLLVLGALLVGHWAGAWQTTVLRVQASWSRTVLRVVASVGPTPLGWKLEPRLAAAVQRFIAAYTRQYEVLFHELVGPALAVPLVTVGAAGTLYSGVRRVTPPCVLSLTSSSFAGGARPLLMGFVAVVALSGLVLWTLAWVLRRASVMLLTSLRSLGALFRGRLRSTLRGREVPLTPPLDTLLLGLLLGAAALLLAPVVLLHWTLLELAALPVRAGVTMVA